MRVHFFESERKMATYAELCAALAEQDAEYRSFFVRTQRQMRAFLDGYIEAVGAPDGTYEGADGKRHKYVRLLRVVSGVIEIEEPPSIAHMIKELDVNQIAWFGMAIALESAHNSLRTVVYTFKIGFKWIENEWR
ncbi:MAG: hypothetical protein VB141_11180 [Burkholderia gladioli]